MLRNLSVVLVTMIFVLSIIALCKSAKAGIYTTTYTTPDGRVFICTTITDNYGTPINVNCIGG